ncbi:hypothetical protein [Crocosphaera chwakensis]|uniref:Uncharacterized protein n=1 Tax=Crocosphaera chwakensis CCY0110 TaxID=391612 RepID=A3IT82_9CHRO|nr:hypothetical protein [Crocosphaera chwakensis]EAZ90267.1 hypothetical protein CY0110_04061 [Crocosphaera chwakensis CCY0110]
MGESSTTLNLVPYIIIGFIPGIINGINAWITLEKKYFNYVFFKPLKSFLVWIWLLIQIYVPGQIYWWVITLIFPEKPDINVLFILMVVIYGICFPSLLDVIEQLAIIPRNVSIIINCVENLLEDYLTKRQTGKTSDFWSDLEEEIEKSSDLLGGIKHLKNHYFYVKYNRINEKKYQYFKKKLEKIAQNKNTEELISTCFKGIIPRQDLLGVLKKFKVSKNFIDRYFK